MSTAAQVFANRANSQNSTGPRSLQGKAAVAQNARRHGLSGSFSILAHEDRAEFDSLLTEYRADFQPQSAHEAFLVEEMAQSRWILARARRLEAHVLDQLAGAPVADDPDARIAAGIVAGSRNPFTTVQRYVTTAGRAYYHAHRELTHTREQASQNKANDAGAVLAAALQPPPQTRTPERPPAIPAHLKTAAAPQLPASQTIPGSPTFRESLKVSKTL